METQQLAQDIMREEAHPIDVPNTGSNMSSEERNTGHHVHWSTSGAEVHDHLHRNDFTPEEKLASWLSKEEIAAILKHPRTHAFIVSQMARRGQGGFFRKGGQH